MLLKWKNNTCHVFSYINFFGLKWYNYFPPLVLSLEERRKRQDNVLKGGIKQLPTVLWKFRNCTSQAIKKCPSKSQYDPCPCLTILSIPVHCPVKTLRFKISSQHAGCLTNNMYHAVYPKYISNDICTSGFIPNLS